MQPDFELGSQNVSVFPNRQCCGNNFTLVFVSQCIYTLDFSGLPGLWTQPTKHPHLPPAPLRLPHISGPQPETILPSPSPPLGDIRKCLETFWGCWLGLDTRYAASDPTVHKQPVAQDDSAREAAALRSEALHQTPVPPLPTSLCAPAGLLQAVPSP